MVVWFLVLAGGGAVALVERPAALQALSPLCAARYVLDDPRTAFLSLGSVVLAVTGAEALYADLGHFGRPAISRGWLLLVMPALVVAYLGEAGTVASDPSWGRRRSIYRPALPMSRQRDGRSPRRRTATD